MRWINALIFCVVINITGSGPVYAAGRGAFRISDWVGQAYWTKADKQFERCSVQLTNTDQITIIYSLDHRYFWNFELSNPAWNFAKGASFTLTLKLGNSGYLRVAAVATDPQLLRLQIPDSLDLFESLRRIVQIELIAGGLTSHFNLAYDNQVLTALTQCVVRYGSSWRQRATIAAWANSLGSVDADAAIHAEASKLASYIMTEAEIPKAVAIQPSGIPAGLTGDAFWKIDRIFFSVLVLPNEISAIDDLPKLLIGSQAQKCRGDFFTGASIDSVGALRVARVFTNCLTQQAATSIYYLAVPRKKGGIYLLTTATNGFELAVPGEPKATEVESKISRSLIVALAKLDQKKSSN